MIVSHDYRFVFVNCMKNGTHTMKAVLAPYGGIEVCGWWRDLENTGAPPETSDYFTFALCRNPYTRAISLWWHALNVTEKDDPEEMRLWNDVFAGRRHLISFLKRLVARDGFLLCANQTEWFSRVRRGLGPIVIERFIKIENLANEFTTLPFAVAHEAEIPRENPGGQLVDWHKGYMNSEVIRLVNAWAEPDFKRFGYPMLEC